MGVFFLLIFWAKVLFSIQNLSNSLKNCLRSSRLFWGLFTLCNLCFFHCCVTVYTLLSGPECLSESTFSIKQVSSCYQGPVWVKRVNSLINVTLTWLREQLGVSQRCWVIPVFVNCGHSWVKKTSKGFLFNISPPLVDGDSNADSQTGHMTPVRHSILHLNAPLCCHTADTNMTIRASSALTDVLSS